MTDCKSPKHQSFLNDKDYDELVSLYQILLNSSGEIPAKATIEELALAKSIEYLTKQTESISEYVAVLADGL